MSADYYAAIPLIRQQLREPPKVQEMLAALTSALDITAPDDRYYENRVNGQRELTEYANGSYDLFHGKHRKRYELQTAIENIEIEVPEAVEIAEIQPGIFETPYNRSC